MTDSDLFPVAFYFRVVFNGLELAFKEVTGLSTEIELENIAEGGVNNYQHRLPKQVRHPNLVLKRALNAIDKSTMLSLEAALGNELAQPVQPVQITVSLLTATGVPLYSWLCDNAYPVKWEIDALDAEKNSMVIETLEFSYTTLQQF